MAHKDLLSNETLTLKSFESGIAVPACPVGRKILFALLEVEKIVTKFSRGNQIANF